MAEKEDAIDEELREMKTVIRSLLIARGQMVSFEVLSSDYKNQMGKPLNYKRFGYDTPLQFVRDLEDTVQVVQTCGGFKLLPVPHKDSDHISRMVSFQKKRFLGHHPPSVLSPRPYEYNPPNQATETNPFVAKPGQRSDHTPQEPSSPKFDQSSNQETNQPCAPANFSAAGLTSSETAFSSIPDSVTQPEAEIVPQPSDSKPSSHKLAEVPSHKDRDQMRPAPLQFVRPPLGSINWKWPTPIQSPILHRPPPTPYWNMPPQYGPPSPYGPPPGYSNVTPVQWFSPNPGYNPPPIPSPWRYGFLPPTSAPNQWHQGEPLWLNQRNAAHQNWNQDKPSYLDAPPTKWNSEVNDGYLKKVNSGSLAPHGAQHPAAPVTGDSSLCDRNLNGYLSNAPVAPLSPCLQSQDNIGEHSQLEAPTLQLLETSLTGQTELKAQQKPSDPERTSADSSSGAKIDLSEINHSALNSDFKQKIRSILMKYPNGLSIPDFLKDYEDMTSEPFNPRKFGYPNMEYLIIGNPDLFDFEKHKNSNKITIYAADPLTQLSQIDNRQRVPSHEEVDIFEIIKNYPEGITTERIMSLYKEKYSTEMNPEEHGFISILDLLKNCSSVCVKEYHDVCLVYPKYPFETHDESHVPDPNADPAAPFRQEKVESMWRGIYKEFECGPSFQYKHPIILTNQLVYLKIVEVQSPGRFWVQFAQNIERFEDLMFNMGLHYEKEEENYYLPNEFIEPGLAVAVFFEGTSQWHRARIESFENEKVEVCYVDFGTVESVKPSDLRKLDMRFGQDPMYAVRASMHFLQPRDGMDEWSNESCRFLFENYAEMTLLAYICGGHIGDLYDNQEIELVLCREEAQLEIVNDVLIKKGLASFKPAYTSPETDPLVSKNSFEVNLNASNIDVISKLMPLWLTTPKTGHRNIDTTMKNIKFCVERDSLFPIDPHEEPCCLRHLVQRFFFANPVRMSQIWEAAHLDVENLLLKHFHDTLLPHFVKIGWGSFSDLPPSCPVLSADFQKQKVTPESQSKPKESRTEMRLNVEANPFFPPSPNPVLSKLSTDSGSSEVNWGDSGVQSSTTLEKLRSYQPLSENAEDQSEIYAEETNETLKADHSYIQAENFRSAESTRVNVISRADSSTSTRSPFYNSATILPTTSHHIRKDQPEAKVTVSFEYPAKTIKYTMTYIGEKPLHLIVYDCAIWVPLVELFVIANVCTVEGMIRAKLRITGARLTLALKEVTQDQEELRAALNHLGLGKDLFALGDMASFYQGRMRSYLVRLVDCGELLRVLDPVHDYDLTVAALMKVYEPEGSQRILDGDPGDKEFQSIRPSTNDVQKPSEKTTQTLTYDPLGFPAGENSDFHSTNSMISKAEQAKAKVIVNLEYPNKSISYTGTKIDGKPLHIFIYERELFVCLSELYVVANVHSEDEVSRANQRIVDGRLNSKVLEVPPQLVELRAAMNSLGLGLNQEAMCLVSLVDAGRILNALDPKMDYEPTVAVLKEKMQSLQGRSW